VIPPEQAIRHHRYERRGGMGGTGTLPSFILPVLLISSPDKRISPEPKLLSSLYMLKEKISNDFLHHENRHASCPHYESVFNTIVAGLKSGTQERFPLTLSCERKSQIQDTPPS
jgi:hypothetical protein